VATLIEPAPPERGPVAQLARGIDAAVAHEPATTGVLLWPARLTHVTAGAVRSLVAAHATDPIAIIRHGDDDAGGFPALFPVEHRAALETIGSDRMPGEVLAELADAGLPVRTLG
jgi:hypothetical protein